MKHITPSKNYSVSSVLSESQYLCHHCQYKCLYYHISVSIFNTMAIVIIPSASGLNTYIYQHLVSAISDFFLSLLLKSFHMLLLCLKNSERSVATRESNCRFETFPETFCECGAQ